MKPLKIALKHPGLARVMVSGPRCLWLASDTQVKGRGWAACDPICSYGEERDSGFQRPAVLSSVSFPEGMGSSCQEEKSNAEITLQISFVILSRKKLIPRKYGILSQEPWGFLSETGNFLPCKVNHGSNTFPFLPAQFRDASRCKMSCFLQAKVQTNSPYPAIQEQLWLWFFVPILLLFCW